MSCVEQDLSSVLKRPLCRRYVLGIFDVAVVRLRDAGSFRDCLTHWGFGWLSDGECEPLGVWAKSDAETDPEFQLAVIEDLKCRGVERIWRVAGLESRSLQEQVASAFPCAKLTSFEGRDNLATLPERTFKQVRAGLSRSIRRYGTFEARAEFLGFMANSLQRSELRLDRERLAADGQSSVSLNLQLAPVGV